MFEFMLFLGQAFVFGLAVFMHICSTIKLPGDEKLFESGEQESLHPWFIAVETILMITMIYTVSHIS